MSESFSTSKMQDFERIIGMKLPQQYVDFVSGKNDIFDLDYLESGKNCFVSVFFEFLDDEDGTSLPQVFKEFIPLAGKELVEARKLIPFADDGGGNYYCLELVHGEVWLFYIHTEPEEALEFIASFDEFFQNLEKSF